MDLLLLSSSDFLVRVRAQVMTRDESTEGWLPMSGGGLAHVSIRKRAKLPPDAAAKHEYIIFGQRISDQTVILSCVINRDLQVSKTSFYYSQLQSQSVSYFPPPVLQSNAHIPPLACGQATQRTHVPNSSRCSRLRQSHRDGLRRPGHRRRVWCAE